MLLHSMRRHRSRACWPRRRGRAASPGRGDGPRVDIAKQKPTARCCTATSCTTVRSADPTLSGGPLLSEVKLGDLGVRPLLSKPSLRVWLATSTALRLRMLRPEAASLRATTSTLRASTHCHMSSLRPRLARSSQAGEWGLRRTSTHWAACSLAWPRQGAPPAPQPRRLRVDGHSLSACAMASSASSTSCEVVQICPSLLSALRSAASTSSAAGQRSGRSCVTALEKLSSNLALTPRKPPTLERGATLDRMPARTQATMAQEHPTTKHSSTGGRLAWPPSTSRSMPSHNATAPGRCHVSRRGAAARTISRKRSADLPRRQIQKSASGRARWTRRGSSLPHDVGGRVRGEPEAAMVLNEVRVSRQLSARSRRRAAHLIHHLLETSYGRVQNTR